MRPGPRRWLRGITFAAAASRPFASPLALPLAIGLALTLALAVPIDAPRAEERPRLRIASWHLGGIALSMADGSGGHVARPEEDFERLARVAGKLDADVVALQGVSNLQALHRLFPARTHHIVFSRQAIADVRSPDRSASTVGADDLGYTAIAVRRSELIRAMRQQHLPEFVDAGARRAGLRPRAATALEVRFAGRNLWLLSVDLVTGCEPAGAAPTPPCSALARQSELLADWMGRRERAGIAYAVAGRLGRPLPRPGDVLERERHPLWAPLYETSAEEPAPAPLMPSRIAPLPKKFRDSLLTVATPTKEVRLPQFNPPSRAPNERLADRLARERAAVREDAASGREDVASATDASSTEGEEENGFLSSVLSFLGVADDRDRVAENSRTTAGGADDAALAPGAAGAEAAGTAHGASNWSGRSGTPDTPTDASREEKSSVKRDVANAAGSPPGIVAARGVIAIRSGSTISDGAVGGISA